MIEQQIVKYLRSIHAFIVQNSVDIEDMIDFFHRKSPSSQSNGIYTTIAQWLPARFDIWWYVFAYQGTAADESMLPNTHKLMDGAHASQDCPVVDEHVAGDLGVVAHNAVVANDAIVGQVAIGLYEAIAANDGLFTVLGAAVDSDEFANSGIVSNKHI